MGIIHADIELINADDLALVRRNKLDKDEVKRMTVSMLVDTGAYMMINEGIQEQLQFFRTRMGSYPDGRNGCINSPTATRAHCKSRTPILCPVKND